MKDKKVDTSITDLIKSSIDTLAKSDSAPPIFITDKKTPSKGRKRMPKVDPNINKQFKIQRIGYSIVASISANTDGLYKATIISVAEGDSPFGVGESIPISKRELELSGRKLLDI